MLKFTLASFTLTPDEALRGYVLSGVPKEKKQKCKITTAAFCLVALFALYNVIRFFVVGMSDDGKMLRNLYLAVIFVCGIVIYGTWKSYRYGFTKAAEDIANGTVYNVSVSENGFSVEVGSDDEVDFERTEFKVAEDDKIFLVSTKNGRLILPKRVLTEGDEEFISGLITGKIVFSGDVIKTDNVLTEEQNITEINNTDNDF